MLKRSFDILLVWPLIVLCSFPVIISACTFALLYRENPFFISYRTGKYGEIFRIYKLKTLQTIKNNDGTLLDDCERMTSFGNFLRKTSLDELPQLLNIVKGDMSFVGPRPLLPEYQQFYTEEEKIRLKVIPGITGLAQIKGRNQLSWSQKFRYDRFYVKKKSFLFDLQILIWTIPQVLRQKGITRSGQATVEKWQRSQVEGVKK